MADGIVLDLASKALLALAKPAIKKAASWWGARDDLKKLENTIRMIQARVRDAETRQEGEGSEAIKEWLRRLKMALYRADDLFDQVLYTDRQKQHQSERRMMGKVGILFSNYGPFNFNRKLANEIKSIRRQLDAIKSDMNGLNLIYEPVELLPMARLIKQRETASFVRTEDVIGREDDQKFIIDMLFNPQYDSENITVIPIVGFGGLGKTTLAQLVFNNERVHSNFELTKWVYVPEKNNMTVIMGKIFYSFTDRSYHDLPLEEVKKGIRKSIENKKYLLVLDDLWDDEVDKLTDLLSLLKCGKQGSKVLVTTRSNLIAEVVCTIEAPHKLGTLTDDKSRELFNKLAFKSGQEHKPSLIKIGEEIVKMCGNMPLAIKAVGGILRYKNTEQEWSRVLDNQRSKARRTKGHQGDNVIATLKLSYDYLTPELKQCFAYCSLIPKGDEFKKDDIVELWMAQGYIYPSNKDVGDQYFLELLTRNLFQGVEGFLRRDVITKFKMHDLLHDLAHEVTSDESMVLGNNESTLHIPEELIHIHLRGSMYPPSLMKVARRLRSLLLTTYHANHEQLISENQSLRVLRMESVECNTLLNSIGRLIHLRCLDIWGRNRIKYLPDSIGRLIHLRYLNLGYNVIIKYIPDCITRLENLETFKLMHCVNLRELPRDFAKLTNVRHLLLPPRLNDLPPGFGKMTSLQELNIFIVGGGNGLDSLGACWNHGGHLTINFLKWRRNDMGEVKRAKLKDNHQLTSLSLKLDFEKERIRPSLGEMNEMLKCLQLPPNLKIMEVWDYISDELPRRWLDGLSHLVFLRIYNCVNCKVLPEMSQLPLLKSLQLGKLYSLEYVEDESNIMSSTITHNGYFRSLEDLKLEDCSKLKGWKRASMNDDGKWRQLVFPSLLKINVEECQMLMSMPLAPQMESLEYEQSNGKALKCLMGSTDDEEGTLRSTTPSSSTLFMPLKKLHISRVDEELTSLAINSRFCNLSELRIYNCSELRNIRFESPSSIRSIEIHNCKGLRNTIEVGLQHLSRLEKLEITWCQELEILEDEEEKRNWQGLTSLRVLELTKIPKMKRLPGGIFCLTTIEELTIERMENLIEIPEEICNLSLLRKLKINECPKMTSLPPSFMGLPSIQHLSVSHMNLTDFPDEIGNYNLPMLRQLSLRFCPKLKVLPTSLKSLTSLQSLEIVACPELSKRYTPPDGEDYHLIQHNPDVKICGSYIEMKRKS